MAFGKSLNTSVPQFPHLQTEESCLGPTVPLGKAPRAHPLMPREGLWAVNELSDGGTESQHQAKADTVCPRAGPGFWGSCLSLFSCSPFSSSRLSMEAPFPLRSLLFLPEAPAPVQPINTHMIEPSGLMNMDACRSGLVHHGAIPSRRTPL